jgi:mRNA-degrading endonuclease toxin of MazEF toxin-antitoxin module
VAFRFGDVLLVPIIFSDGTGAKKRPVLIVHDTEDIDLLVVPVTSHQPRGAEDVTLHDWRAAGLRLPSTARMSKLATIAKSTVIRKLGQLTDRDAQHAREALRRFFKAIS